MNNKKKLEELYQRVCNAPNNKETILTDTVKLLMFKKLFNVKNISPFKFVLIYKLIQKMLKRQGVITRK